MEGSHGRWHPPELRPPTVGPPPQVVPASPAPEGSSTAVQPPPAADTPAPPAAETPIEPPPAADTPVPPSEVDVAEPTDDRTGATTTPEEGTDGSEPADADSAAPEGTGTQPDVAESEPETFDEEEWISVRRAHLPSGATRRCRG